MSKFIAIANNAVSNKLNVGMVDSKDSKVLVGEPVDYEVNRDYVSLSRAMAELDVLEGVMVNLVESGYRGKVFVTCHKGLALKISALFGSKPKEIWQKFMNSSEGPWAEYISRIKELAAEAKKAGMILSGTPTLNLRRSEVEISGAYELTEDGGIRIGDSVFHDGDKVTFTRVSGRDEDYRAEAADGSFVSTDVFVHGERELHIVAGRDGRAYVNVIRFMEPTEDGLPDSDYGDQISWLRYAMQAARASLREGRAPRAKAAA